MPRLRISRSALEDLQEILDWHARHAGAQAGRALVAHLLQRMELLEDHPEMGRIVPEFGLPFLREIIHPPFRIVYRREAHAVTIVRVWRGERHMRPPRDGEW